MSSVTTDAERKYRAACAAQGIPPNLSIIAKMRSGEYQQQAKQAKRRNREHRAYLTRLRHEGYSFDTEHRLVAPALARIYAPERRENVARPRERRARRASTASRASPGDSDPEPPLRVIPHATYARVLRSSLGGDAR